jgi:hypothetical protein
MMKNNNKNKYNKNFSEFYFLILYSVFYFIGGWNFLFSYENHASH